LNNIQRRTVLAALGLAPLVGKVSAQQANLVFASTMPVGPAGASADVFLNPWINEIAAEGKGVVAVQRRDGPNIATMANSYDRVMNDVVQIAWSLQPLLGGKFPLSEVAGLPFITPSCEAGSVALWRLFKSGILDSEYQDVVPLWFALSGQNQIHFAKAPKTVLELDGLKINVFNRSLVQVVEKFRGTPVSAGPEQVYESLQRGSADGTMTAWTSFRAYKLGEVTQFHVAAPFGSSVHMFFMSRKKFEALPAQARKVLLEASGEKQSRRHGRAWDESEVSERKNMESKGHTVVDATPAQLQQWKGRIQPIIDTWKARPNGEKVLDAYTQLIAQVESEIKRGK
jgi:TRAP-type C4-dicarboxylate transport system substrate-binding protein